MADDKKSLINLVPESIDNAAKNITDAPTKNMGQTMADLWFLIFGGITQAADKRRAKYNVELNKFKEELAASIEKIPEKNRKEPSSQVVLSALDEAKFCVEEEELRKLFVSLLTSASDSTQNAHPSYANIIRQMSPDDAIFLSVFKNQTSLPLCNLRQKLSGISGVTIVEYLCLGAPDNFSEEQTRLCISSLIRLGICTIPAGSHLSDNSLYEPFKENEWYKALVKFHGADKIEIEKRYLQLTPFGKSFITSCLP